MLKMAWDFFLSISLRAVFTLALLGGVTFLVWTYDASRTGFWDEDEQQFALLSFVLAGITTLVGLMGTFRRGKAEAHFSIFAVAGIVAGAGSGHIHAPGGRTLRRFPSIESVVLGGFLILLWLVVAPRKEVTWVFRTGAIIGGAQIAWGIALEYFARKRYLSSRDDEPPKNGPEGP